MKQLQDIDGDSLVRHAIETNKPLFGICVGMQILFTTGDEKGNHEGLGYFQGNISKLEAPLLPHIGWNNVEANSPIFDGLNDAMFYFVHSYAAKQAPVDAKITWTTYGERFIAAIEKENIFATQFHPEKSGDTGAKLISNWAARI
jgi:glutamine amidotransferase